MDFKNNHPVHAAGFALATAAAAKVLGYQNSEALIGGVVVGSGAFFYMSRYGHSLPSSHPAKLSSFAPSTASKPAVGGGVSQTPTSLYSPALTARLAELRAQLPNSGPTLEERVAALRGTLPPPPSGPLVGTTFAAWYGSKA
jgi:hypothetical protein